MQSGDKVYMLTGKGVLMPGVFVGPSLGRAGLTLMDVQSPAGKVYSAAPHNVFDVETGAIMLMHRRAEQMAAEGYEIAVRLNGTFRVYQSLKHGVHGGWIVSRVGKHGLVCNCPAHAKACTCKHVMAVCSLLHKAAQRKRALGRNNIASRYANLAMAVYQGIAA